MIPVNTEMVADLFDAEAIRGMRRRKPQEDQLRQRGCDETQLHEAIDAFAGLDPIGIKPEMLLGISEGSFYLLSLSVVFNDLGYLKRHVCCKDAEIPIRF